MLDSRDVAKLLPYFKNAEHNDEWLNFSCPLAPYSKIHKFKEDLHPSAGLSKDHNNRFYWHCFSCKSSGNLTSLFSILQEKTGKSYKDIVDWIDDEYRLPEFEDIFFVRTNPRPEAISYPELFDPIESHEWAIKYLNERNVSVDTAKKLNIQANPDDKRVVFPITDAEGNIFGFTSRSTDGRKPKIYNYFSGDKSFFFLGHNLWKNQPKIIVEGLFAYARLHEITKDKHFPYDIGATMGSRMSEHQARILYTEFNPVYCFYDNDLPGQKGTEDMARKLVGEIPFFIPTWPKGLNDPDNLSFDDLSGMINKSKLVCNLKEETRRYVAKMGNTVNTKENTKENRNKISWAF